MPQGGLSNKEIRQAGKRPKNVKNTTLNGGVPIDDVRLNKLGRSGTSFTNAFDLLLPTFSKAISGQLAPADQAILASALATIPGFADLQRDIALKDADTTRQIFEGDLSSFEKGARTTDRLGREFDPEFFDIRSNLAAGLAELLAPGLTGGERAEVERSVNRDNFRSGNLPGTGSNLQTVGNAITFGNAARNRLQSAINTASQVLPQLRTGVASPGGISATPGTKVQAPQAPGLGQTGLGIASGLISPLSGVQQQQVAAHLAPKASDLERGVGVAQGIGSTFKSLTSGLSDLFSSGMGAGAFTP